MKKLLALPLLLTLTLIQACAGGSGIEWIDTSCTRFKPLTWSSRDTDETRREIFAHNLTWDEVCAGGSGPGTRVKP